MSEEVRRSVRSTKGIHSHKEQEIEGNTENSKKKNNTKKATNKKATAASKEPSPALEKNSDGDIIRCVCGATSQDDDDEGEAWVCCDKCEVWEHNVCMGVPTENIDELPHYYCENCAPENHEELLESLARGEKIWEERRKVYEAGKKARKNRKGKGGGTKKKKADPKPAVQHTNGQAKESPAAAGRDTSANAKKDNVERSASTKRKSREDSHDQDPGSKIKQRKVSSTSATPVTPATSARQAASATPMPPPSGATPTNHQVPQYKTPSDLPKAIDDLHDDVRRNIANFIHNRMKEAVKIAAKNGHVAASHGNSLDQQALRLSLELERAIHDSHPNQTSYSEQSKRVANNIKINQELCDRLLSRELSAGQLAVMSSDDMKSSKLRQQDEEVVARAERQSIMVTAEDGPRIRRTHKGEELVEDFGAVSEIPSREQRDPNMNMGERSRENTPDDLMEPPADDDVDSAARPKAPLNINTQAGTHERKPSLQASEFDYNKLASKLPTPTHTQPNRRISDPVPIARETIDDPDVDRLLDDVPESPPYSPKEDSDPSVIWSGQVTMSGVAQFDASAKHVGGVDLTERHPYPPSYLDILGGELRVTGRIEPEKATEYLCGLRYSPGSDMVVISITPCGEISTAEFTKVFDYFMAKERYAVIGARMGPSQVRDIYLVPLEAGNAAIPLFMSSLEVNKLAGERTERSMLIVIVYREETPRGLSGNGDGTQSPTLMNHPHRQLSQVSGPAMSPLSHQGSFKSPIDFAQQQMAELQRTGETIAKDILGPDLINAPTVAFIMPNAHAMVAKEWHVIKDILTTDPKARTDLQYLGELLSTRANQTGNLKTEK